MRSLFLLVLVSIGLYASPILTIDNPNLSVAPGSTGEWTFRLTPDDTYWFSVTASFLILETNPSIGVYMDEVGFQGGPDGRLAPGAPDWASVLATYEVPGHATVGAFNSATLLVLFELFSEDPFTCDSCHVASSSLDFGVSISVVPQPDQAIPEPGTWQLLAAAAGLLALTRLRRRRA